MKNKNIFSYIIIFLFTFSYFIFFNSNNYLIADDTIFHTSNILVMKNTISISNLIPDKILPTLVNNLGYGVNIFYPMFPHLIGAYLAEFFDLFNIGIAGTMKFIHFMIIFLSGICMYKYIDIAFKNKKQALLTAILYQSTPYLFTDVFMRGAYNESFLFIYLPIIFLGLYYLFETKEYNKFYLCFILGYTLLIYSHLVLTIYLTIFLIPILLIYYRKLFNTNILNKLIIGSILILLITSNFWGPLLEHNLLKIYYIFNLKYVNNLSVQIANIIYYFLPMNYYPVPTFKSPNYFLLFYISPICLSLIICNYFSIYKQKIKKEHNKPLIGIFLFLVLALFLASNTFIWNFIPNILKNIQFTWRIAIFVAFSAVILAGYGIRLFSEKTQKILLVITIIFGIISNYNLTSKLNYKKIDEIDFLKDSCCKLQWSYEYLPVTSKMNSLQLYNKNEYLGESIKVITNDVPNMKFEVFDITNSITIEFPRIYYLGYKLTNEDGKEIKLYQNGFGLLEAKINENGTYYLTYPGTKIDRITKFLSQITITSCIIYIIFIKKKRGNN